VHDKRCWQRHHLLIFKPEDHLTAQLARRLLSRGAIEERTKEHGVLDIIDRLCPSIGQLEDGVEPALA
jgi:hypothetical protein